MGDNDGASNAVTDIAAEETDAAASRLAAKALFVIYAQDEIGGLTSAEDEVRASVPADALAMAAASSG